MNIKEIKANVPLADVYELRPDSRYLFVITSDDVDLGDCGDSLHSLLRGSGIAFQLWGLKKDDLRIFELTSPPESCPDASTSLAGESAQ